MNTELIDVFETFLEPQKENPTILTVFRQALGEKAAYTRLTKTEHLQAVYRKCDTISLTYNGVKMTLTEAMQLELNRLLLTHGKAVVGQAMKQSMDGLASLTTADTKDTRPEVAHETMYKEVPCMFILALCSLLVVAPV